MKKYIVTLLAIFSAMLSLAAAEDFQAVLEPAVVMEGEGFVLLLSNKGRTLPQLLKLPENFTYRGSSQSTRVVNGDSTVSVGYNFAAPAPGEYTIAPLDVKLGKKTVKTPPLKLKVVKDNNAGMGVDDVFAKGVFAGKRKVYYVGEDIPLSVNLYYPKNLQIELTAYPVLDIGKSVFRDFRKVNPENPAFARPRQQRQVLDDKLYNTVVFPTAFRPLAPGELTVKGNVSCNILIPDRRRSSDPFDDFFGGGTRYRRIERKLMLELPPITVKPLPPVPQDGFFLGLTGNFTGEALLSENKVNALEPVSLDLTLQALNSSSFETLQVPELAVNDCRVYPGEVRYNGNKCTISYALVPLKAGLTDIEQKFYFFDPQLDKYKSIAIDKVLQVSPAVGKSSTAASTPVIPAVNNVRSADKIDEDLPRTTLLYCKKSPTGAWSSFYRRNRIALAVTIFIVGPVLWLLTILFNRIRRNRPDHAELRRERAKELRNALYEKVSKAPAEDLPLLASGEIADYLSDRWKLPAGSTLEDVAQAADNKDLAEALQTCANISYLPKAMMKTALADPEKIRKLLLGALKTLVIFFSIFPALTMAATPQAWHEALKAYDQGKYSEAKAYFEKYQANNPSDANVYYNLGCIAEANNEPEMALYYLESAGLLAPLDSATHENRQVMRRKFFLASGNDPATPQAAMAMLRDRLHPDDYLMIAACCFLAFFILLIFRNKLSGSVLWGCGAVLLGAMTLALILMFIQYQSSYRSNQALVVAKNAELFSFPGKHNGKKLGTIAGGTPVEIVDAESDYSLVASDKLEGWTLNKNIRKLPIR